MLKSKNGVFECDSIPQQRVKHEAGHGWDCCVWVYRPGKTVHLQMPVPSCAPISGFRHSLVTLVTLVTLVGWRSVESLGLATQAWWRHSRLKLWATQDPGHFMLPSASLLASCMFKFHQLKISKICTVDSVDSVHRYGMVWSMHSKTKM